jgi:hypothetical protein
MKRIEIIGGGTVSHVRNHLALTAPAYGQTARELYTLALGSAERPSNWVPKLHLTKMACGGDSPLETNEDISGLLDGLLADPATKIIFFNPALVDFDGSIHCEGALGYEWAIDLPTPSGKYQERLKTSDGIRSMGLTPGPKLIDKIRKARKDIFLVGFKTTCGATEDDQFLTGLNLLKSASCNLVLANDTKTRTNMIITPEQARYHVTTDRNIALFNLVKMTLHRASLTFTRSTVVDGESVSWNDSEVPESLRTVVNHCIARGAYKPFRGSTVGHFAVKVDDNTFFTSKRKTNFNQLDQVGLVKVVSDGPDSVIAYGAKPSVGGQSQRIIFKEHPELDCIVHFHVPPKDPNRLSVRSQELLECGSHQCGKNTSDGLVEVAPGIKCVYLDNHGPNIVFNRSMDPKKVIEFIDNHFDLTRSTDQVDRSKHLVA